MRRDYSSLGCSGSTSTSPCAATTRLRPHALYVDLAMRRDYSSPAARALHRLRQAPRLLVSGRTRSTSTSTCTATTRLRPHALHLNLTMRCHYSSPAARAQRQPRHAPRVLVITLPAAAIYLVYAARPGASARRAAHHAARRAARSRLHRASGCRGTSRGSSRGSSRRSSSTTPPRIARRRLLRLASLVVDYSASSRLVVDYSMCRDFILRPRWLYFSHAVRGDYFPCGNTGSTSSAPHAATTSSFSRIASTIHLD
jgi:hypothetical protein